MTRAYFEIDITPVSTGRPFTLRTILDGAVFNLAFRFNPREGAQYWVMDLADAGNTPIQSGLCCRGDWPLLIRGADERRPVGQLYLRDTTGQGADPGPYDLGARHRLVYDNRDGFDT